MSREAFDIEAALDKCHKGTAWQRDLIRAQLIAAKADAYERAARSVKSELLVNDGAGEAYDMGHNDGIFIAVGAIRALAKELGNRKTICARIMSDGKPCGLRGPCPDCGPSLNDFGPDEETGAGK